MKFKSGIKRQILYDITQNLEKQTSKQNKMGTVMDIENEEVVLGGGSGGWVRVSEKGKGD